ncbi:MAG: thioredoxin domain-containing protein [Desulfurococcales archaeon]|nr:thioredoxin domain-containing protein [Desulfurococcales archaeon]
MAETGCERPNRLARARSPYLRMHACDPVDWRSWDDVEPLLGRLEKPLFISIGYSSCHWCHVMHRESFMNPEVARALNEAFIPVKVDREERPDVDEYYMAYCMVSVGSCGWPLNVLAMPDGKPFFAATYMRPGDLIELARAVKEVWESRKGELESVASKAVEVLEALFKPAREAELGPEVLDAAYRELESLYDPAYGGFGERPKFPESPKLVFLLYYYARRGVVEALDMAYDTVDAIASGGIHDKVWGGIHRYTIDRDWRTPHFEKMLYDQAMIARILGELELAGRGSPVTKWISRKLVDFLESFMMVKDGGLASALDAESGGIEGGFYTWTLSELEEALGDDFNIAKKIFGFREEGNYVDEVTGGPSGRNILHATARLEVLSGALGYRVEELLSIIDKIAGKLRSYAREKRVEPPARDDKVVASWNGLAVWGLSRLRYTSPRALELAVKVANFIEGKLIDGDRVYRAWLGEPYGEGFLDDYAHLALGFIELHEALGRERYLEVAYLLARAIPERFQGAGGELRLKPGGAVELQDGPYPSGYSAAVDVMARLGRLLGDEKLSEASLKALKAASYTLASQPTRYSYMLVALDFKVNPSYEVVIALEREGSVSQVEKSLWRSYTPARITCWKPRGGSLERLASHLKSMQPIEGKPTIYICREGVCSLPTTDPLKASEYMQVNYRV